MLVCACKRDAQHDGSNARESTAAREFEAPAQGKAPAAAPASAPANEPPSAEPSAADDQASAGTRDARFRVAQSTGAAEHQRAPLGTQFRVPEAAELSLDLVNGARVKLEPGSRAWLLDAEPATLLLIEGALHAQLPPQGSAAGRPALRIATADYAVEIPASGELWLSRPAANGGKTARPAYFAQLSGTADLEYVANGPQPGLITQQLVPGQSWVGMQPPATISPRGPKTLDEAKRAYEKLRGPSKVAKDAVDPSAFLESALAAWTETDLKGRAIIAAQREANEKGETATVRAKQSELVGLAKEKLALRKRVRLGFELACGRAIASFADANSELARFEASYMPRVAPAMPPGT
jgi:hypothetical protein